LGHAQPNHHNLTDGGVAPFEPFERYARKWLELAGCGHSMSPSRYRPAADALKKAMV
jgi:hypothetical protein